ncbi:UDP-Glycosyltransferase/glycogen phosphorylase [Hortaea werneckii]|nr:UDP-Glycosyltransferase/glycogen phosphorylase [Hortaea werneckii]KAI7722745.1 UDP-Glycosyltransferase/glycogen phosphorylase [Hortaea werneckii]
MSDQPAVWTYKHAHKRVKLSKMAAAMIVGQHPDRARRMKVYKSYPLIIEPTRWDPFSGGASAVLNTVVDLADCVTGIVTKPIGQHQKQQRQKKRATELQAFVTTQKQQLFATSQSSDNVDSDESTKSNGKTHSRRRTGGTQTALAGVKSIGSFAPKALKGMLSDIPLAMTEGLRTAPRHYGDTLRDNGRVTGIASGFAVAGKTFMWGFVDGVSDVVVQPYKDIKNKGATGLVTGIGKGITGLYVKTGAGILGTFAYPATGITRSLESAIHSRVQSLEENAEADVLQAWRDEVGYR